MTLQSIKCDQSAYRKNFNITVLVPVRTVVRFPPCYGGSVITPRLPGTEHTHTQKQTKQIYKGVHRRMIHVYVNCWDSTSSKSSNF